MKRTDLLKKLREAAKANNLAIREDEGANHTKVTIGSVMVTVPRHREINELTAKGILKKADEAAAKTDEES